VHELHRAVAQTGRQNAICFMSCMHISLHFRPGYSDRQADMLNGVSGVHVRTTKVRVLCTVKCIRGVTGGNGVLEVHVCTVKCIRKMTSRIHAP
jgi:hypothetical protein